jgi:diguanylate cyclase (GGDEF)-like protein
MLASRHMAFFLALGAETSVTATEFWPLFAAPLINGIALLLALGFRRNRAVIMLAVLTFSSIALAGIAPESSDRGEDAARMFAPWLLVAAAALPERRLLARRNLILLLLLAVAVWLTLAAPSHVWPALRSALPFGLLPWSAAVVAGILTFLAAALCLLRWVLHGAPMEAGLCIVLILVALALLPILQLESVRYVFALAGVGALTAILYASYRMAFVDALAGLPNRRALDEALARISGGYALAMVDVDHFKQFNDTHGHDAGDRVLQSVAQQLRSTRGAHAYRYGGEEFCLLFTGARAQLAKQACEEARERIQNMRVRVRSAPAKPRRGQVAKRSDPNEVKVTVSIGLAERDAQLRTSAEVLKAADQALYKAKAKGRNRLVSR